MLGSRTTEVSLSTCPSSVPAQRNPDLATLLVGKLSPHTLAGFESVSLAKGRIICQK